MNQHNTQPGVAIIFRPAPQSSGEGTPTLDFVVSRYADGRIASRFGDTVWDWTPYVPSGKRRILNFQFWPKHRQPSNAQQELVAEMHWLMYLLAFKRPGAMLGYQSLLHYVKTFRAAATHCESSGVTLRALFLSHERLIEVVNELAPVHSKQLSGILSALAEMGPGVVGFAVAGAQTKNTLRRVAREYTDTLRQHPPLPARIYSHVIATLMREMSDFEQIADSFLALTERCITNPQLGRTKAVQWLNARRRSVERGGLAVQFTELVAEHGLTDYFENRGLNLGVFGLSTGLSQLQTVCRLAIQAFSGMREGEVGQLRYTCLETSTTGGRPHHVIVGTTTKLNHGKPKVARWVTSGEGARAVRLAQRLANLCHKITVSKTAATLPALDELPLFASVGYLGLGGQLRATDCHLIAPTFRFSTQSRLRTALQPVITESDLKELEQIDPHRAWRAEPKFQLGQPWTLTTHQLRRSLALYAQRSGLVSLPSLRRQLKHLTEEMSRYYARGSAFADDFIGKDIEHFGNEWREMQPVSAALSYILNVLTTDDVLFGAHSNWVEHRLQGPSGELLVDRETTIKRFKKGELAYKETFLGGCTSTEVCTTQPLNWLSIDCVKGCKNMVGRVSKLDRAIAAQKRFVEGLDCTTPEFRAEQTDLRVLLSAREKVQEQITESKP